MNGYLRLQQTAAWVDIVELRLCLFLYDVCNDWQFESMPGSDFANFLNLKPTQQPVTIRPRENLRICYMVYSVAQTIKPHDRGKRWGGGVFESLRNLEYLLQKTPHRHLFPNGHRRKQKVPQIHRHSHRKCPSADPSPVASRHFPI